jgi:hypothetical protein
MHKTKHTQLENNREMPVEHRNTYEQWRELLVAEHILSEEGLIDVERLEKKHPNTLDKNQIIWLEAMQKGEIIEEGDDVELDEPITESESEVKEFNVGDAFKIQVDEDGQPVRVTVVEIGNDGIHLAPADDESTEYLVEADELAEMIVS